MRADPGRTRLPEWTWIPVMIPSTWGCTAVDGRGMSIVRGSCALGRAARGRVRPKQDDASVSFVAGLRLPQLSLFEAGDGVLADDERGRIAYTPRLVSAAIAHAWFSGLRHAVS